MLRICPALLLVSLLAACAAEVKGPSVAVKPKPALVIVEHEKERGRGFCPPGLAMQGRC